MKFTKKTIIEKKDKYKVKIYNSDNQVIEALAVRYQSLNLPDHSCKKYEIKFKFDFKIVQGLWFMNDKTPIPAKLRIDAKNYFSIKIPPYQIPVKLTILNDTSEVVVN